MHVWAMMQSIVPRTVMPRFRQPPIETGRLDVPVGVEREERGPEEQPPRPREIPIGTKPLQNLGEDHRDQASVLPVDGVAQAAHLAQPVEPVGPDGCVDDDHRRARRRRRRHRPRASCPSASGGHGRPTSSNQLAQGSVDGLALGLRPGDLHGLPDEVIVQNDVRATHWRPPQSEIHPVVASGVTLA